MRRYHRKSRNGCSECKRRHVKCDETRPCCVNCNTSSLQCSFQRLWLFHSDPKPSRPAQISHVSLPPQSIPPPLSPSTGLVVVSSTQTFSMQHLGLLHNFETRLATKLHETLHIPQSIFTFMVQEALSAPYLMYQILALSALSLSTQDSNRAAFYRRESTVLQTHALVLFNSRPEVAKYHDFTALLFTGLLCNQHLWEMMLTRGSLSDIIRKITSCLHLYQGLRELARIHWPAIQRRIEPHFDMDFLTVFSPHKEPREADECGPLYDLVSLSSVSSQEHDTFLLCVEQLSWMYAFRHGSLEPMLTVISAWPLIMPAEYIDLLGHRRPEALIILAYYAVLWHDTTLPGSFNSISLFVVQSINNYLGAPWDRWLAWPRKVLGIQGAEV